MRLIDSQELFAGLTVVGHYKPSVDPDEYPIRDTRPSTQVVRDNVLSYTHSVNRITSLQELDLEGLEDDPTFWDMGMDDDLEPQQSQAPTKCAFYYAHPYVTYTGSCVCKMLI
jgi:ATP-dependent DNA helicase HFM1/MER3